MLLYPRSGTHFYHWHENGERSDCQMEIVPQNHSTKLIRMVNDIEQEPNLFIVKIWIPFHATFVFKLLDCSTFHRLNGIFNSFRSVALTLHCHRQSSYETMSSKIIFSAFAASKYARCFQLYQATCATFVEIAIAIEIDTASEWMFCTANSVCDARKGLWFR